MSELQRAIDAANDQAADTYETQPGHAIGDWETAAWLGLLERTKPLGPGYVVLDVGSGTGVMSRLVARTGSRVVGLEPSEQMLEKARTLTTGPSVRIDYRRGDTHDESLFSDDVFDLVVCRQAVCYFHDPLKAFANWRNWLKPGGRVLVVEGLWRREDWNKDVPVDQLPLSCLQTMATIPYVLRRVGFSVETPIRIDESRYAVFATNGK